MRFTSAVTVRNDLLQLITDYLLLIRNYLYSPISSRGFVGQSLGYSGTHGNHGGTVRKSYTVGSGKRAEVSACAVSLMVLTAPTGGIDSGIFIEFTPSGGTANQLLYLLMVPTAINDRAEQSLGGPLYLEEGDKIEVKTYCTLTSGVCRFSGSFIINEFDA